MKIQDNSSFYIFGSSGVGAGSPKRCRSRRDGRAMPARLRPQGAGPGPGRGRLSRRRQSGRAPEPLGARGWWLPRGGARRAAVRRNWKLYSLQSKRLKEEEDKIVFLIESCILPEACDTTLPLLRVSVWCKASLKIFLLPLALTEFPYSEHWMLTFRWKWRQVLP
ncbi:uncharacterized protein LOC143693326 [Agelaius phoeniceus]|uniref:uncharacterized protein LOC143693326 n=1 Tax=Agelaius phoeniceus TaxID=39638 RepID=UPI004054BF6D